MRYLLFSLRFAFPDFVERFEHQQARKRSRPIWQAMLSRDLVDDGKRARRFRLLHLQFEFGLCHAGRWYWDRPLWLIF
jgi:hypothetical protein